MTRVRARGEDIRRYIIEKVEKYPSDVSKLTADKFEITRQAVNKHLQKLAREGALLESGKTRSRTYKLAPLLEWSNTYPLNKELTESDVWNRDIKPRLGHLPDNVMDIWHYGFTEMFNNAIDHSGGSYIHVSLRKTAADAEIVIMDNGVGIFRKIQSALNLIDERHSVLELAKGKFTTDPKNHTGQGIFFTSRMLDSFDLLSGGVFFSHDYEKADWITERDRSQDGTTVFMKLYNHTARTEKKVFDAYSGGDDYAFRKTIVPVRMAQYGDDNLVSRSQAKRVLVRVDKFTAVIFDFKDVPTIGQAFADEIFRVFAKEHPHIEISVHNASSEVKKMISRARSEDVKPIS